MQLTIDSSQSLDSVLPVIGAIWGVNLVVSSGESGVVNGTAPKARKATGRPGAKTAAKAPRKAAKRAVKTTATARRSGGVDASVIRTWAREQGITVSERGQLPKSVLSAYTDSH